MNILVIRLSSMGDVILASVVFEVIKQQFSQSHVSLLTKKPYNELFGNDPRVDQIILFEKEMCDQICTTITQQTQWDFIVDLQNNAMSKRIRKTYFNHCNYGVFNKLNKKRIILLLLRINTYTTIVPVISRYVDTLNKLLRMPIVIPHVRLFFHHDLIPSFFAQHRSYDPNRKTLVLVPFSAWKNKQWLFSNYVKIGKQYLAKNWNVVIIAGPEEIAQSELLSTEIGERAISCAGHITLAQIGSFLFHTHLALGNDTGLSHLCRACGVKTGFVFGSTTRHFGFYPTGYPPYRIFESNQLCRPCHFHGGNRCFRVTRPCLRNVTVEMVLQGLQELEEPQMK